VRIPSDAQIRKLHEKYAPTYEAFDVVYTHCEIVCGVAEEVLARRGLAMNADLVRAGSLLHDIGVYRLDHASYVRHGLLGHDLLRNEGFPEVLCRFCSCHTGMGLSREDVVAQRLPLPVADYLAESPEERLVMYADKFHSKSDPPRFLTADTYSVRVAQFGEDKVATFASMRQTFGEPDLAPFAAAYGHAIT
jgi:uncharacterized protein